MGRTVDSILQWFETAVHEREVITPSQWVDASLYLASLMGEEYAKLAELEHQVAVVELSLIENMPASKAKIHTQASTVYKEMRLQKFKCDRILEFIRLGKKRAQMASDELRV